MFATLPQLLAVVVIRQPRPSASFYADKLNANALSVENWSLDYRSTKWLRDNELMG
jgi:hypothetical protein